MDSGDLAYLAGALLGDGYTYKGKKKGMVAVFTQKNYQWLKEIEKIIERNGGKAWIFKQRNIYVLETRFSELINYNPIKNLQRFQGREKIEFISGFFDADGGIPKHPERLKPVTPFYYVQFVQKDKRILTVVRNLLESFGIQCGRIHKYDGKKDIWRFFVRANSLIKFLKMINSRHPEKKNRIMIMLNRLLERQTR